MKTYIQITGGRGPVECARVVTLVFQELLKEFPELKIVDTEPHNKFPDCYMSIVASTDSINLAYRIENEWAGTIQWQAKRNQYRPNHKRKNWFVSVNTFSENDLIQIDDKDIVYESMRSGGTGGQNVNKVESAVRATHIPTGISVKCSEERDQPRNKKRAKEILILKLNKINDETIASDIKDQWNNHNNVQRGNPVKIFKGDI